MLRKSYNYNQLPLTIWLKSWTLQIYLCMFLGVMVYRYPRQFSNCHPSLQFISFPEPTFVRYYSHYLYVLYLKSIQKFEFHSSKTIFFLINTTKNSQTFFDIPHDRPVSRMIETCFRLPTAVGDAFLSMETNRTCY